MKKYRYIFCFLFFHFAGVISSEALAQKTPSTDQPIFCNVFVDVIKDVSCRGGSDGAITVHGNPLGSEDYYWYFNGATTPTVTGLTAGTYTVQFCNDSCCQDKAIMVGQPAQDLGASSSHTNEQCQLNNGTVTVGFTGGGTPPYTFLWNPGGYSSATVIGLNSGTYNCTVTDKNGCTVPLSETISNNGTPVNITGISNTLISCYQGTNGTATVNATGGSGYTYAWIPSGGSAQTATGLGAGNYTVTVTSSAGCSDQGTVGLMDPSQITISNMGEADATCGKSNGSAFCNAAGGTPPISYSWNPSGQSGSTASNLPANTYSCTITDGNGCTKVVTLTVGNIGVSINAPTTVIQNVSCKGGGDGSASVNPTNGTGPYTYAWTPFGNLQQENNLTAQTYNIIVTDADGCTGNTSVNITEPSLSLTTTSSSNPATCGQSNGNATTSPSGGTPGYNYSWSPAGGSGPTTTQVPAGTYTATVTDSKGCVTKDVVFINSTGGMTANVTVTSNVSCFGGSNGAANVVATGGTPPYTYSWSPSGGNSSAVSNLFAGTSNVVMVTDNAGCVSTKTLTVTQPAAITGSVSTNPAACASANGTATASVSGGAGSFSYLWTPGGQISPTATGLSAGTYSVTIHDANNCSKIFSGVVSTGAGPVIASSSFSVSCNGGNNGSATAAPTAGGGPPYTYLWNTVPAQTTPTATGLSAGTYSVTVSTTSCTNKAVVTVAQPAPMTASITTAPTPCLQSTGSASAIPGGGASPYTYSWSPGGQTTQTATGLFAGSYTVVVKDKNGCSQNFVAFVNNSNGPGLSFSAAGGASCFGASDGSATVNVSGGTSPYVYSWSPSGGTTSAATGLSAGIYSVLVSDAGGCINTGTVSITEPTQVLANVDTNLIAICFGAQAQLGSTPSGGNGGYTFNWVPAADLDDGTLSHPVAGPTGSTNYTVTATDAKGCTGVGIVSVTVHPIPAINAGPPLLLFCKGFGTTLSASGGVSYTWSPSTGLSSTSVANPVANPSTAITYSLVGTDIFGCVSSDTIHLQFAPSPTITVSCANTTVCAGAGTTTLNAAGGATYVWSPGVSATAVSVAVSPDVPTTFTVVGTTTAGCSGKATISISVIPGYAVPATSSSSASYCIGDSILSFSATPNPTTNTISWTDPANSFFVTGTTYQPPQTLAVGNYTVLCVQGSSSWCMSNPAAIPLSVHPLPLANAGNNITICPGHSAQLKGTGGTSYLWSPTSSLSSSSIANPSADPASNTAYQVIVTDGFGCKDLDSVTVFVVINDTCGIVIYNLISPNADGKNDAWWIDGINFFPENSVNIFNRWGAKVWEGNNYDNDKVIWSGMGSGGNTLPDGTYYYVINLNGKQFSGFVELLR